MRIYMAQSVSGVQAVLPFSTQSLRACKAPTYFVSASVVGTLVGRHEKALVKNSMDESKAGLTPMRFGSPSRKCP